MVSPGGSNETIESPFDFSSTTNDVLDGADITGRRIVVTGGGSGLGLHTAEVLASRGAEVTITVRSTESGSRAAETWTEQKSDGGHHRQQL